MSILFSCIALLFSALNVRAEMMLGTNVKDEVALYPSGSVDIEGVVPDSISTERAIELLLDRLPNIEDSEGWEERLIRLSETPIDVNTASEERLLELPFFDAFFVRNLLLERSKRGVFQSLYDLKTIQGAPIEVLPLLVPFLTISTLTSEGKPPFRQSIYVGTEGQLQRNADNYKGLGWGIRYSAHQGERHTWSVVFENDRGENVQPIFRGFGDFFSVSYQYRTPNTTLIVGDYRVGGGLGVLLGQHLSYYSRAEIQGAAPSINPQWLHPHSGFRESGFLRGVAGSFRKDYWQIGLFYGVEPIDARLAYGRVVTVYSGGKHRTASEVRYRHTAYRSLGGVLLEYQTDALIVGAILNTLRYRHTEDFHPLLPPHKDGERKTNNNGSVYFQYHRGNWRLSGEALIAPRDRHAMNIVANYFHDYWGNLSVVLRYLGAMYSAPYGLVDSHYSAQKNEKGCQIIWSGDLWKWWKGVMLIDLYKRINPDSHGSKGRGCSLTAITNYRNGRYAMQNRLRLTTQEQKSWRATAKVTQQFAINSHLHLRVRANVSYVHRENVTWGVALRMSYEPIPPFLMEGGVQYFSATNGVISADQPYLPWHYYMPMLRGRGIRCTARMRFKTDNIQISTRYAETFYSEAPKVPLPSLIELTALIKL